MSTSTAATPAPGQTLPEDQLLELLIQLQKTTPEQARVILNSQPQIGYALMPLMAKMGAVSLEVVQRTLAAYTTSQAQTQTQIQVATAAPAVPTHLTQQQQQQQPYGQQPTPSPIPPSTPAGSYTGAPGTGAGISALGYAGYPPPPPAAQNGGYPQAAGATQVQYEQQQGWNAQPQPQAPPQGTQGPSGGAATSGAPGPPGLGALGNIPEDQREMIIRVLSMTPDQIRSLPPQERAITVQLRATLGLPVE